MCVCLFVCVCGVVYVLCAVSIDIRRTLKRVSNQIWGCKTVEGMSSMHTCCNVPVLGVIYWTCNSEVRRGVYLTVVMVWFAFLFWGRVSLCSLDWSRTLFCSFGLKFIVAIFPVSALQGLGLQLSHALLKLVLNSMLKLRWFKTYLAQPCHQCEPVNMGGVSQGHRVACS